MAAILSGDGGGYHRTAAALSKQLDLGLEENGF
jgi:hypothetical protein